MCICILCQILNCKPETEIGSRMEKRLSYKFYTRRILCTENKNNSIFLKKYYRKSGRAIFHTFGMFTRIHMFAKNSTQSLQQRMALHFILFVNKKSNRTIDLILVTMSENVSHLNHNCKHWHI